MPIGAFTSQPIGNFSSNRIDHRMKEEVRAEHVIPYAVGLSEQNGLSGESGVIEGFPYPVFGEFPDQPQADVFFLFVR